VGLYREQDREDEYSALLSELAGRPDSPPAILVEYADHRAFVGDFEVAAEGFRRALALGLVDTAFVVERQEQYPGLQVVGN